MRRAISSLASAPSSSRSSRTSAPTRDQSDDEFTENLLGKLDEARTHINRHTHAAFYIKEMCGNADEPCLNTTDYITNLPQSTGKVHGYTQQGLCFQHVLEHEKYNVAEGFDFVNISMTILKAGASFCKDPQLTETVAQMRDQLETSMAYHRSNDLFKQLSNGHMQNYCTGAELDLSYDETYAAASENIDASVMAAPNCSFAAETAAKMPWMTSNPPAAIDLIHVFEMNTKITMAVAAEAVQDVLTKEEGCMDPDTGKIDDVESAAILGALNAVNLPQAIYEDMQDNHGLKAGQKFFNPSGSILSGQFMVPSVYHKLAFGCIPQVGVNSSLDRSLARTSGLYNKSTGLVSDKDIKLFGKLPNGGSSTQIATCIAEDGTTMVPLNSGESPIFDIGPSATRCAGEACKTAATATINYQSFLRYITQLRWDAILVGSGGYSRGGGDFYSQDTWTFQRSCDALRNIVTGLTSAQEQLGHILKELKESSPQLDALCVAPPRDFITDEALSVLPTDRAVKNREIWAKGTVSPPGCLPPVAYLPPIY